MMSNIYLDVLVVSIDALTVNIFITGVPNNPKLL